MQVLFRRSASPDTTQSLVADVGKCLVLLQLDGCELQFDLSRGEIDVDAAGERLVTDIVAHTNGWIEAGRAYFDQHHVTIASTRRS